MLLGVHAHVRAVLLKQAAEHRTRVKQSLDKKKAAAAKAEKRVKQLEEKEARAKAKNKSTLLRNLAEVSTCLSGKPWIARGPGVWVCAGGRHTLKEGDLTEIKLKT